MKTRNCFVPDHVVVDLKRDLKTREQENPSRPSSKQRGTFRLRLHHVAGDRKLSSGYPISMCLERDSGMENPVPREEKPAETVAKNGNSALGGRSAKELGKPKVVQHKRVISQR